jgi:hypothetical protein
MESWLAVATLQQRQHFGNFQDTSWPAVDEEERNGSLDLTLLMYEMHVDWSMFVNVDLDFIVWERVQLGFMRSPVEIGTPVINDTLDVFPELPVSSIQCSGELLQVIHRSTVIPTRPIFDLDGKFCVVQPSLQPVQLLLRNVNLVFFDSSHFGVFV